MIALNVEDWVIQRIVSKLHNLGYESVSNVRIVRHTFSQYHVFVGSKTYEYCVVDDIMEEITPTNILDNFL